MTQELVTTGKLESWIRVIRGQQVMLDSDLAEVFETRIDIIGRMVKQYPDRFPDDFVFRLNKEEYLSTRVIGSEEGPKKYRNNFPIAFTEQGVIMMVSSFKSEHAASIHVAVVRALQTFVGIHGIHPKSNDDFPSSNLNWRKKLRLFWIFDLRNFQTVFSK